MNPLIPLLFWLIFSLAVWFITSAFTDQQPKAQRITKFFWVVVISTLSLKLTYVCLPIRVPSSIAIKLLPLSHILLAPDGGFFFWFGFLIGAFFLVVTSLIWASLMALVALCFVRVSEKEKSL